jgi:hypothetical protein
LILFKKNRFRTNLMHLLLPICGKFTRAQTAHQIFVYGFAQSRPLLLVWLWGNQIFAVLWSPLYVYIGFELKFLIEIFLYQQFFVDFCKNISVFFSKKKALQLYNWLFITSKNCNLLHLDKRRATFWLILLFFQKSRK